MVPPLPDLVLYTRPDCHLCDEARDAIAILLADRATHGLPNPQVVERDIDAEPALARLRDRIPIVELGSARLELIVTAPRLRRVLADVLDAAPA